MRVRNETVFEFLSRAVTFWGNVCAPEKGGKE